MICLVYVVLGQAWNLVGGYAGQWSLGHAAFFGLGAYTSTLLLLRVNVTPWLGMIAGGFVAAAVACAIAFPCFKLRTHYFAMATLAIGETVRVLFLAFDWTGGANGLVLPVQRIPSTRDMLWAGKEPYLVIILAMAIAMTLVIVQVERSRLGIYLRAINQDEEAAARLGIDLRRYKLAALAGSAFVTGMTGTFYAQIPLASARCCWMQPNAAHERSLSGSVAAPRTMAGSEWRERSGFALLENVKASLPMSPRWCT